VSRLSQRPIRHSFCSLLAALLFLAGCATFKQCAYEGLQRDRWQQPETVVKSLRLQPGQEVADLGSGSGYFTFRLARAVGPSGKVYAVDIDPDMHALVARRSKEEGLDNVEVVLAKPEDPLLPAGRMDLILTVNTYHHLPNRVSYFSNLQKYLRPSGRTAIIDFDRRSWFEGLWSHYTPPDLIKREMEQAGYDVQEEFEFLDRQSFIVFVKRQVAQRTSGATILVPGVRD
jgi:ubiquinone/menaquinone biosynthesis C-methylase UbiE